MSSAIAALRAGTRIGTKEAKATCPFQSRLLFRASAENQLLRIPAMHIFREIPLFRLCLANVTGKIGMLRDAFFKLLAEIALVDQAQEFSPVHGIKSLQERALQQISVVHDISHCYG